MGIILDNNFEYLRDGINIYIYITLILDFMVIFKTQYLLKGFYTCHSAYLLAYKIVRVYIFSIFSLSIHIKRNRRMFS